MKKLSYLVFAASILSVGVFAAPASAAPAGATDVLSCSSGGSQQETRNAEQELAQELQLSTKSTPTIDEWSGCLKVQYTDANGHTNVALYDPDSLKLVNQLS